MKGRQVRDVAQAHRGTMPGDMIDDSLTQANAIRSSEDLRALMTAREQAPRPALAPAGSAVLILVALALWNSEWALYPGGAISQSNADRSLGVAILAAGAGLRHAVSTGRHLVLSSAAGVAALGSVLAGLLADHQVGSTRVLEVVCGVLILLAVSACVLSPRLLEQRKGAATVHRH
ncbi:MAG: hypothetical protein L0H31_00670 [Nocardioidaceae bacterium]|nr:hypothetical protein [Nocardioidaceae bacterium]